MREIQAIPTTAVTAVNHLVARVRAEHQALLEAERRIVTEASASKSALRQA